MRNIPLVITEVIGPTKTTGEYGRRLRAKIRAIVDRPTERIAPRPRDDIHPALYNVVAETTATWRLGNIHLRHDWKRERHVFNSGMGDLARLRVTRLFLPIIHTIGKIERDVSKIGERAKCGRRDPWAPKSY